MADYSCSLRSAGSEEEGAVSSSQALQNSYEPMWEGWPSSSTKQLGNGSPKSTNSYDEQGLLSPWTISGFQAQDGQRGPGSGYPDEFSRLNICSSSSSDAGSGGGPSDPGSQQLYTPLQNCNRTHPNSGRRDQQSELDLKNNTVSSDLQSHGANTNHDDLNVLNNVTEHILQQMTSSDLKSRTSSDSSAAAGLPLTSYGQMMQPMGGQFDASTGGWADASTSQQTDGCDVLSTSHQEHSTANRNCGGMTLHHNLKEEARDVFSHSGANLSEEMYAELHGFLTKSLQTSDGAVGEEQRLLSICSNNPRTSGSYEDDHSGWTHFTLDIPGASGSSLTAVAPFNMQAADQVMTFTPEPLSCAGSKTDDGSPPSSAGTTMSSTYQNLRAIAAAHGQGYNLYGSADLVEISEFQNKRPCEDQRGQSSVNAEETVKRSCIALFGRAPANYLLGAATNYAGSVIDMNSAVGPALNTNGRPRARRGSATDPQSVYARNRRERINDRLKVLQTLVPNGAKVDIVTMLEEAINYVRFLQLQVRLLSSDELWIYAPTTYNGVDVSMGLHAGLYQNQQA